VGRGPGCDAVNVSLFVTCLADNFYPNVAASVVRVLRRFGVTVDCPKKQTCCGQPALNAGCGDDARAVAARMVKIFEPSELVVTPSGSCCSIVREYYPHLFDDDPVLRAKAVALAGKTFEFLEFLDRKLKVDWSRWDLEFPAVATYHYSCHMRGIGMSPDDVITMIRRFRGLEFRPLEKMDQCCGFGGTFSVKYPDISGALVRDKVACIQKTGAELLVMTDAGCIMNVAGACRRQGVNVRIMHLAEMIDQAMAAAEKRRAMAVT